MHISGLYQCCLIGYLCPIGQHCRVIITNVCFSAELLSSSAIIQIYKSDSNVGYRLLPIKKPGSGESVRKTQTKIVIKLILLIVKVLASFVELLKLLYYTFNKPI